MAISLKESGFANEVIGVDQSQDNLDKAIRRRLIDRDMDFEAGIQAADIVILAIPVNAIVKVLPLVLDQLNDHQLVIDVGSTKELLINQVSNHQRRGRYVPAHPMAGTEFSGPEAAIPNLFDHNCAVICNPDDIDQDAKKKAIDLFEALKMSVITMEAKAHDVHAAYVSHISHISSFALALTVLEKEKDEDRIFELASGGFSSTVRLAKSSPEMWIPIFEQNRDNVLDVLDEHINTLARFRSLLIKKNYEEFHELILESNQIKKILNKK